MGQLSLAQCMSFLFTEVLFRVCLDGAVAAVNEACNKIPTNQMSHYAIAWCHGHI